MKSEVVYVHSIYNSLKIILLYFFHKNIITDMHGIVPEELEMEKKKRAVVYKVVERIVMKNGAIFITVTHNMKEHFMSKYDISDNKIWILSIFSFTLNKNKNQYLNNTFIYSGNIQKWQCIDRLIPFIEDTKNKYRWIVLSGAKDYFSERLDNSVVIKSVKHDQVNAYYNKADFGVVLRENSIVNKVACPTKLIEYISNGLVPIVYDPEIGDFYRYGYRYLTMDDVYNGNIPNNDELDAIRKWNINIINIINDNNKNTIIKLYDFLNAN